MIHDYTNTERQHQNGNIRSNECQTVKDNKKWKNNRRNDTAKPQQITTTVNQYAVLSNITSDCDRQKRLEATNKKQIGTGEK
jgi:hypothetical protein